MRLSHRQPASIFLVHVLRQHPPDGRGWILPVDARQQYGKIAHVHGVFLLEMALQLREADAAIDKSRSGSMMFAIHDAQQFFLEPALGHLSHHLGCLRHRR